MQTSARRPWMVALALPRLAREYGLRIPEKFAVRWRHVPGMPGAQIKGDPREASVKLVCNTAAPLLAEAVLRELHRLHVARTGRDRGDVEEFVRWGLGRRWGRGAPRVA
jgi:hypothetical protein